MITDLLAKVVAAALEAAVDDGAIDHAPPVHFERPRRREHGDWATNVALVAAGQGRNPRAVAQSIVERLPESDLVDRVEVAGPGFLNFHLSPRWLHDVVRRAASPGARFGRSAEGSGRRVNVEYVSANPTGPINVASGRHAAVGDAVANLLEATGHEVTREFYVNDAGRQTRLFAESVAARYLQELGRDAPLPQDAYEGEYLREIARGIIKEKGESLVEVSREERVDAVSSMALHAMVDQMQASLGRFGTRFDVWTSQQSLLERGAIEDAIDRLKRAGLTEEREGALWFFSTRFGDDKDRVLVRSTGEPTYLAADAAYVIDKFGRGFDRLIYLLGADHHGALGRMLAVAEALGFNRDGIELSLVQMVSISGRRGSKRAGVVEPLDNLVEEVGADAARYTFLTRSVDAPLDFDIELVKEQAPENPVYYVQYAHARICSLLRKAGEQGAAADAASAPLELLVHPSEDQLMRKLAAYEEVVPDASATRAPQKVTRYVEELASTFSAFYRDCRVVSENQGLTNARLTLSLATKVVIADALGLLGVGAPERM